MIVAVGLDVVGLERIAAVWKKHPTRFLNRHFTEAEISYCLAKSDPVPSLAARFCAKEAFQKCWLEPHGWRDVWVEKVGKKPILACAPKIAAHMRANDFTVHLSLTHSRSQAAAVVVLEQLKP